MQRYRTCTNPKPKPPGRNCNGRNWEEIYCNHPACPVTSMQHILFPMEIKNEIIYSFLIKIEIRFNIFDR